MPHSRPRRVVLATANAGKLRELQRMLAGDRVELLTLAMLGIASPPEDGDSFAANALIKARHAAAASGLPAIGDDSGLEVDALGGRPGLYSARYAGPAADAAANNRLLLEELAAVPDGRRGATFRCAMAYVRRADDPQPVVTEGSWRGQIGFAPRGTAGFGYDPLFVVDGDGRSAAELDAQEKDRVSHRGQALARLVAALRAGAW